MAETLIQKLSDLRSKLMNKQLIVIMLKNTNIRTKCELTNTMISHSMRLLALGNERKAYRFYAYALILSKKIINK